MTAVITPACMVCGKTSEMEVDSVALHRWQKLGVLIQVAFPDMPAPEREQLKTGTHPACWDEMFSDEDDGEPKEEHDHDWADGFCQNPFCDAVLPDEDDEGLDFADPDPMYTTDENSSRL